MANSRHTLRALLVIGLCFDISMPLTNLWWRLSQVLKFTKIMLKYPEDDAITLCSVFSTLNTALDTLPLSLSNIMNSC